jgi:Tfp pilus assembly protein PilO
MKRDMVTEFAKITGHFEEKLDRRRLMKATERITKEEVKKKTGHDPQVVQLTADYVDIRDEFKKLYSQLVWDTVLSDKPNIMGSFSHLKLTESA